MSGAYSELDIRLTVNSKVAWSEIPEIPLKRSIQPMILPAVSPLNWATTERNSAFCRVNFSNERPSRKASLTSIRLSSRVNRVVSRMESA